VLSLDHEIESNADYVNGFEGRLKNLTDAISSEVEATDLVSSATLMIACICLYEDCV
jgi:hypothetical protein